MLNHPLFKKILPHLIAVTILIAIGTLFFAPYVFEGRVLEQGDNLKSFAMQAEVMKVKKETGEYPFWTNSMFSGMPAYQIYTRSAFNALWYVHDVLMLGNNLLAPQASVIVAMLMLYLLLMVLRVDWRIGVAGAIAFGLSTFNMDIIEAGHSTKMAALSYAPAMLAGAILAIRGRYLLGGSIFAIGAGLQIACNHYQITYYTLLLVLLLGIVELVNSILNKKIVDYLKTFATLAFALILGVATNLPALLLTYEYQAESIRGKTELTKSDNKDRSISGGLGKDYAFQWSYGVGESMTLLVPNYYGGGASEKHDNTQTHDAVFGNIVGQMTQQGINVEDAQRDAEKQVGSLFYTGTQPFVGVSIYWGAIVLFLFVLGLFLIQNRPLKWWLGTATLVMLMVAWGKNFFFADVMFDYFPLFNKFRAVTQALGIGQLLAIIVAMLGLQAWFDESIDKKKKTQALMISFGILAFFCLIGAFGGGGSGRQDEGLAQQNAQLLGMLQEDRAALAKASATKSFFFILLTAGVLWAFVNQYIKQMTMVIGIIGALVLVDTWTAAKRIIYEEKFQDKTALMSQQDQPRPIDTEILQDKAYYRVLDVSQGDPFTNSTPSYFHKSAGGYHAAKLMRYQELIEAYLSKFEQKPMLEQPNLKIYGMLNTRYIIMSPKEKFLNPYSLGNAWFVKNTKVVKNADEELAALGTIEPRETALFSEAYAGELAKFTPSFDSTATIQLTKYHPDRLEYTYTAQSDQLAVFSEVYYPAKKGWKLLLNDKEIPFTKADYLLRAAKLPAGTNQKLVMQFEPQSFFMGQRVSTVSSLAIILLLLAALGLYWRQK